MYIALADPFFFFFNTLIRRELVGQNESMFKLSNNAAAGVEVEAGVLDGEDSCLASNGTSKEK